MMTESSPDTLEELNEIEAHQYVGGLVFVAILMCVGFVGNLHVLFVYALKIKPSNHRIFILMLGVLDFITCIVGMPFIIMDLRNPLTFTMVSACKVLRFINYFICTSSALTLLVIAVDRYRKICVPLGGQITQRMAKGLCGGVLGLALLLSWPAPVLYGADTITTANPHINGTRCYTEDRFKNTKFQAYFNAVLILVVFGIFGVLVVLYSMIGRAISKHKTFKSSAANTSLKNDTSTELSLSKDNDSGVALVKEEKVPISKIAIPEVSISSGQVSVGDETSTSYLSKASGETSATSTKTKPKATTPDKPKSFERTAKTTFMLFLITLFFFISYVPHLVLKIVTFANKSFVPNLSFTGKVLYNTFIWCFFINNVVNCFIYGFCDRRFRTEVKALYSKLFCRN